MCLVGATVPRCPYRAMDNRADGRMYRRENVGGGALDAPAAGRWITVADGQIRRPHEETTVQCVSAPATLAALRTARATEDGGPYKWTQTAAPQMRSGEKYTRRGLAHARYGSVTGGEWWAQCSTALTMP